MCVFITYETTVLPSFHLIAVRADSLSDGRKEWVVSCDCSDYMHSILWQFLAVDRHGTT